MVEIIRDRPPYGPSCESKEPLLGRYGWQLRVLLVWEADWQQTAQLLPFRYRPITVVQENDAYASKRSLLSVRRFATTRQRGSFLREAHLGGPSLLERVKHPGRCRSWSAVLSPQSVEDIIQGRVLRYAQLD